MYLRTDREFKRRRRNRRFITILVGIVLVAFAGYQAYGFIVEQFDTGPLVATPAPISTPTPAAGYYIAEAADAYMSGQTGEAIAAYLSALELEPNQTQAYIEVSRLLTYNGQPERALTMAKQALERQPNNARAWAVLCLAYDWLGMPDLAVSACEQSVSLDPTLPEAYAFLAEAYIDNGQWYLANDTIVIATDLDASNVDVLRCRAYVLENQGNYYDAITIYRQAAELYPNLAYLHLAIGRNARALANYTSALAAFRDAVAAETENPEALDQLGWTYLLLGDYDKARTNLLKAIDIDPTLADAHGHLATAYFQQRNYEDAILSFKPAIDYAQARSRRGTVRFAITLEDTNAIGSEPAGRTVAYADFLHPAELATPMRGHLQASQEGAALDGLIRFDVMNGRYTFDASGFAAAPVGQVYLGWFEPLFWPEGGMVHTVPIFPAPDGSVTLVGETGAVEGAPIENYYIFALSYYYLDQCDLAKPYIQIALRIAPEDPSALQTWELCQ